MHFDSDRALELLRIGAQDPAATFRDGQSEAIQHVVEGKGRLLVVQKTGWGKSFVYFIATKILREQGLGPTLLVSPLLALMRNQTLAAGRMGVRAETINSTNQDDWDAIEELVSNDAVDVVIVSPERFGNDRFREKVLGVVGGKIGLLVVDEAHCISDWGHDFRPHYRLIKRIAADLPPNLRLLATTATANDRVIDDLKRTLGEDLTVVRGGLERNSLKLQTISLRSKPERLAWLAEQVPDLPGSGIIYTLTKRDATEVAGWLGSRGLRVEPYTAASEDREGLEDLLLGNEVKALVATTALGMGYDKPDLGFIVHYQTPGSVVAYYQQVGRGGRALETAYGILLAGEEDEDITDYFIRSAFPSRKEVEEVVGAIEASGDGLSIFGLMSQVNMRKTRLEKTLQLLRLESPAPVVKEEGRWRRTASSLSESFWERAQRLTELRMREAEEMQRYVALDDGHMEFLVSALSGDPSECTQPDLPALAETAARRTVQEAEEFLRRTHLSIQPRAMWPKGVELPSTGVSGTIEKGRRAEEGRALCAWGSAGWGAIVKKGKYEESRFSDELVSALAALIGEWAPDPAPAWVTCIPSLRHPYLVPDLAERLAKELNLPLARAIVSRRATEAQKTMENSARQAANLDGAFGVETDLLREGPVLLVDDMVDSRWTMTMAAYLLREAGAGPVWPVALAYTGHD